MLVTIFLTSLTDILAGSAGFFNNYNLCHIKSINWDEILTGPGAHDVYVYNFTESERNCSSCHPSCPAEGGCWGPGPDNCQRLSKINCSPQCHGGRCFGPEPRQCCHLFCAGGCTGPTQSDCLACRNFYDNGVCKQECPSMNRYNSITYSWEPNPDGKFAYGATCVRKCPEHLLKDNSACVRACPANKKAKNGECVPCDGPCPKTCPIEKLEIIHAGNIDKFKNCTILQGSLQILQHSFHGYQEIYENYTFGPHHGKMHPSKLEVFNTVKEITGFVNIDAYHPEFRDLGFLRRLEVIGGRYLHEYFSALYVVKTSLESLRLDSLQKVRSGGVMIVENKRLCFADGIRWQTFISSEQKSQSYDVMVDKNRAAAECGKWWTGNWGVLHGPHINCKAVFHPKLFTVTIYLYLHETLFSFTNRPVVSMSPWADVSQYLWICPLSLSPRGCMGGPSVSPLPGDVWACCSSPSPRRCVGLLSLPLFQAMCGPAVPPPLPGDVWACQ